MPRPRHRWGGPCASAVRCHTRQQVGSDCQIARLCKLVGDALHPVGHAENLVDYNHRGRLGLRLRWATNDSTDLPSCFTETHSRRRGDLSTA